MKKILSVFLSVLFLLAPNASLLLRLLGSAAKPTAQAANDPTVNGGHLLVNGAYVTDGSLTVLCGTGTAEFDPETNTLTLNNAVLTNGKDPDTTFERAYDDGYRTYAAIVTDLPQITVAINGGNTCGGDAEILLRAYGNVTLTGNGSVTADNAVPIEVRGDVTFDNAKLSGLTVSGGNQGYGPFRALTVRDSTLSCVKLRAGGDVHVENSTLTGEAYTDTVRYYSPDSMREQTYSGTVYRGGEIRCADSAVSVTGSRILHTSIRTDGDIRLENSTVYDARFQTEGALTARDIGMEPGFADPPIGLFANVFSAEKDLVFSGKNALWSAVLSGDRVTVENTESEYGSVTAMGDLTLDGCALYGTDVKAYGAFLCKNTKADAKDETQDSKIEICGTKAEFINCDFGGIAETRRGERQVSIGNGLPMVESFEYNTLTGVSILVWFDACPEGENVYPALLFKNSRLILSRILTYTPDMQLTVDETRLMLCQGALSNHAYDYDKNVTIKGNIDIVTGYWGSSSETGIFIDYLGDYYTFDQDTGTVRIYNHYGALGFRQDSSEWVSDGYRPTPEYAAWVKKVVVGDEMENPPFRWFMGFDHLLELDFGNGITELDGGYPDWTLRDCTALETVTFGSNLEYFNAEMLTQCPNLKTVIIKSEKLSDSAVSEGRWGFQSYNPNVKIYVPASQVERFKAGFPHYKDQIFALDAAENPGGDGFMPGDVDLDKQITAADARLALRRSVGLETYAAGSIRFRACDVDFDGNVTAADARLILRASVGLENASEWKG